MFSCFQRFNDVNMKAKQLKRAVNEFKSTFLYQAVIVFIVVILVIPALVYFLVFDLAEDLPNELSTCVIEYDYRVPCGFKPGREMGNITLNHCKNIDCCFDKFTNSCYQYFTSKYGYRSTSGNKFTSKTYYTPLDYKILPTMYIDVEETEDFIDFNLKAGENLSRGQANVGNSLVSYNLSTTDLTIDVYRKDTKFRLLTTSRGPLIASDGYWEWTVQLTNRNGTMYGLGGVRIEGNVTRVIHRNDQDHSNIPFFLAQQEGEYDVEYHAALVRHKGILEVQVLESNLIILRAMNASMDGLSLRFFPGPRYEDIQRQLVGMDVVPKIPRWLLGTHICRNGVTSLQEMLQEFGNGQQFDYLEADSDCFNEMLIIMLIENDDRVGRRLLRETIGKFRRKHFILPFSPHIPVRSKATELNPSREYHLYKEAVEMNVLLTNATGAIQYGWYKNRQVSFFNTTSGNATKYLTLLLGMVNEHIIDLTDVDGVFLLDNWVQDETFNFLPKNESLHYYNEEITLAANRTPTILLKNQQSFIQSQIKLFQSLQHLFGKNVSIFSAAHYHNMGTFPLPQHVNKTWANMKDIIARTLFTNMLSTSVTLNPVCGTDEGINSTMHDNELCARWFINQATLPGLRITTNWYMHANFTKTSRNIVKKALEMKKMLSYYQYAILRESGTIIRPMFTSFPRDNETWSLDEQYLMGNLIVVPILLPQATMRRLYLPTDHTWFEFWGGMNVGNGWKNISVSRNERLLFLRERSAVPVLKETKNEQYFDIIVAKPCAKGRRVIEGSIFFDEEFLKFEILDKFFHVTNIKNVQKDINCPTDTKHPHIIKNLQMLDCSNSMHTLKMNFDICHAVNDTIYLLFPV